MSFNVPEKSRITTGPLGSTPEYGNNGAFKIKLPRSQVLKIIAGDGFGWEHVSVSRKDRCPTWEEMCIVKELFWTEPEDYVIQYHPPRSDYVNLHEYCLHLWRPIGIALPRPPSMLVGPR